MMIQTIIVIAIIAAACLYAGSILLKKRRAFSSKPGCDSDCGCSGASKKLPS
ncbi:MAG: FeoB-associated Cys-rich membrane protein [Chloracidobacterium sp.]|nr:FeoB-associated Cys-rich membrane protein [Chloracidobacterium sp.]